MSAAIVTGSYATVASALDYWVTLSHAKGVTSDAYLTQPVGVNTLNFGPHAFRNLLGYNNPDGINSPRPRRRRGSRSTAICSSGTRSV